MKLLAPQLHFLVLLRHFETHLAQISSKLPDDFA